MCDAVCVGGKKTFTSPLPFYRFSMADASLHGGEALVAAASDELAADIEHVELDVLTFIDILSVDLLRGAVFDRLSLPSLCRLARICTQLRGWTDEPVAVRSDVSIMDVEEQVHVAVLRHLISATSHEHISLAPGSYFLGSVDNAEHVRTVRSPKPERAHLAFTPQPLPDAEADAVEDWLNFIAEWLPGHGPLVIDRPVTLEGVPPSNRPTTFDPEFQSEVWLLLEANFGSGAVISVDKGLIPVQNGPIRLLNIHVVPDPGGTCSWGTGANPCDALHSGDSSMLEASNCQFLGRMLLEGSALFDSTCRFTCVELQAQPAEVEPIIDAPLPTTREIMNRVLHAGGVGSVVCKETDGSLIYIRPSI